jgi:hypothetical protein
MNILKILRLLVALALVAGGSWILFEGGISRQIPHHVNWACSALGTGLLLPGALLLLPLRRLVTR